VARDSDFFSGSVAGEGGGQPGSRERPLAIGGSERELQRFGRLVQGHPGKEPQLYEFGGLGIFPGEAVKGIVERQEILVRRRAGVREPGEVDPVLSTAPFQAGPVAALVDEDPSHRFGGGGEKVGSTFELLVAD
jgi:hypothetical protein